MASSDEEVHLNGTYVSTDTHKSSALQAKGKLPNVQTTKKLQSEHKSEKQSHPRYKEMVQVAVGHLAGRSGVSKVKICEFIKGRYHINEVNNHFVKKALKDLVADHVLLQPKGTGASGSFKLSKEKKDEVKKSKEKEKREEKMKDKAEEKENKEPKKKKVAKEEASEPPSDPKSKTEVAKPTTKPAKGKSQSTSNVRAEPKKRNLTPASSSSSSIPVVDAKPGSSKTDGTKTKATSRKKKVV